jgi:hypothetical protein
MLGKAARANTRAAYYEGLAKRLAKLATPSPSTR